MLAIVEDQQEAPARYQFVADELYQWSSAASVEVKCSRHVLRDEFGADQGREVDQPWPVREVGQQTTRCDNGQPRLAYAAGTGEGQEACFAKQALNRCQVLLTTDEATDLGRQVVSSTRRGGQPVQATSAGRYIGHQRPANVSALAAEDN
jgi:hypothetical protein